MNTINETSMIKSPTTPTLPAHRLRELLDRPKPKLEEWQDEAGRIVSLLAVQFPLETDEAEALLIVALVGLASSSGVKEAKKKSLKLTRWSKTPPLPLQTLPHLDEQRAALLALAKVKFIWAITYIEQGLASNDLVPELLPELLRWARSAEPDWSKFVVGIYAQSVEGGGESVRLMATLKGGAKLLRVTGAIPAVKVAEDLGTLVRAIVRSSSRFVKDEKTQNSVLLAGYSIFEQAWKEMPALLLQPVMVNVLTQLSGEFKGLKKNPPGSVESASLATLSLVVDSVRRYGASATEQWRQLLPMWMAAYPDFQKQMKVWAVVEPALAGLLTNAAPVSEAMEQSYSAESAFATLLPAWDAFVADLLDPSRASSISLMLNRAAATVHVEREGMVGEVVDYDPLSHHLVNLGEAAPVKVKVLRAGVAARRADGSIRSLVKALVTSA